MRNAKLSFYVFAELANTCFIFGFRNPVSGLRFRFPVFGFLALLLPLFKKGSRDDPNNCRPISVISVQAKVFERIVHDQLYSYLEVHNVICKYQSGFRAIREF